MDKIKNKNYGYKCDKCKQVAKIVYSTEDHIYCADCVSKMTNTSQEEIDKLVFED